MLEEINKETVQYLYSVINGLDDELVIIDRGYRILDTNEATLSNQKKSRDEVIGEYCYRVSHNRSTPCGSADHECPVKIVFQTKKPARVTHIHTVKSGNKVQKRYLNIVASPLLDSDGNIVAIVETMRDVTDAKNSELRILQLLNELEEKDRIRGQLLNETFSIQEEERKRIARELHDETCQVIAGIAGQIEAIAITLPEGQERLREELKRIKTLHTDLLGDMNRLIYELRPSMLDDLGLDAAIRWLVESKLEATGIKVNVRLVNLHNKLTSSIETTLFRVIQEAINNIVRHSNADVVNISVRILRGNLRVRISDDGTGFNVKEAISVKQGSRGLGLQGMKERIELVNGKISIDSSVGNGTEITCTIPLKSGIK